MARLGILFLVFGLVVFFLRPLIRANPGGRPRSYGGGSWQWGQPSGNHGGREGETSSQRPKSPYDVLGVSSNASQVQIAAAYRRLVQQYHPDKVAGMAPEFRELAELRMKEINSAYEYLKRHASG